MKTITVFTPTYNRARLLPQLYASLQSQTFKNFEWLIIDDDSTDATEELVFKWIRNENAFNIRYYRQHHGGKCRAINNALEYAEGCLFFVVDSDDILLPDALYRINEWNKMLPPNSSFCGVAGNMQSTGGLKSEKQFDGDFYDGDLLDRYLNIPGERAFVFFTDIFRKYPYPTFDGENFMTEAVAYNRMAHDGYKMRFYDEALCVYEYQKDGLTRTGSTLFLSNPHGYGLWLREKANFLNWGIKKRVFMVYTFTCDLEENLSAKEIANCISAPYLFVQCCKTIHKLRVLIKGMLHENIN